MTKLTSIEVHQEYRPRVLTKSTDKEYWPKVLAEVTSHISNMAGLMRLKFSHCHWGRPPPSECENFSLIGPAMLEIWLILSGSTFGQYSLSVLFVSTLCQYSLSVLLVNLYPCPFCQDRSAKKNSA